MDPAGLRFRNDDGSSGWLTGVGVEIWPSWCGGELRIVWLSPDVNFSSESRGAGNLCSSVQLFYFPLHIGEIHFRRWRHTVFWEMKSLTWDISCVEVFLPAWMKLTALTKFCRRICWIQTVCTFGWFCSSFVKKSLLNLWFEVLKFIWPQMTLTKGKTIAWFAAGKRVK